MFVDPTLVIGFLAISCLLSAVPGPSVILETSRAISQGRGPAMWIVAGNAAGGAVLLALVVSGLSVLVAASEGLFFIVKIVGALYLLWLGINALIAARGAETSRLVGTTDGSASARRLLRQGFLVGVGNPKSVVSLMAVLPQFVDPDRGHVTLQLVLIGLLGGMAQVVVETGWVTAAGALRSWFLRRPARLRWMKGASGVTMIGMAGRLALEK